MPGSILLAMPFVVVLGSSAYQNFFWIGVLLNLVRRASRGAYAQFVIWMFLLGSPQILWEIASGSDLLANTIFVTIFTALATGALVQRGQESGCRRGILYVILGLTLSSRANFLLGVPLVFGAMIRDQRFAEAAMRIGVALTTFTLVTLPVYVYDPAHFAPLHAGNLLRGLGPSGMRLDVVYLALTAVVTLCLAWAVYRARADVLLSHAAVQFMIIIPPMLSVLIGPQHALALRADDVSYLTMPSFYVFGYGIMPGVFIALALALRGPDADTAALSTPPSPSVLSPLNA